METLDALFVSHLMLELTQHMTTTSRRCRDRAMGAPPRGLPGSGILRKYIANQKGAQVVLGGLTRRRPAYERHI